VATTGQVAGELSLSALLSQVLVAFTIEFDNESEHRMPHRTTRGAAGGAGPWLVSLVMWSNLMRFVDEAGVTVGELQDQGGNLAGMERWGYVVVAPDPADHRPMPPRRAWIVRPTARGRRAQAVWLPLANVIEQRWQTRFDAGEIAALREALRRLIAELDLQLPEYLPVLGYGLWSRVPDPLRRTPPRGRGAATQLPALLSKVLLAFAIEFELESDLSLAICANVMRLLDEPGAAVRDLPRLAGVSKEAISMAVGFLRKGGYVTVEPDPTATRGKLVALTPRGQEAQDAYRELTNLIEPRWRARFGNLVDELRQPLARLVGDATASGSPLFGGLEPYPDGWRASVGRPETLPHYPMVLHRGGYPDGS
jgi:DNA-binding MarR family transcriptional regulator